MDLNLVQEMVVAPVSVLLKWDPTMDARSMMRVNAHRAPSKLTVRSRRMGVRTHRTTKHAETDRDSVIHAVRAPTTTALKFSQHKAMQLQSPDVAK